MKNKLIRKLFLASGYDFERLETYLSEMAAEGLMFVQQKGIFYYFEECEQKNIRFAVDFFDKATIFDTRPEKKTEEYIAYCEECGWHHLYTNGKIQFFYTEDVDAAPIQTDSSIKLKYIHKNVLHSKAPAWCLIPIFLGQAILNAVMAYPPANLVDQYIVSGNNMLLMLTMLVFCIYFIVDIFRYLHFYLSNKKRVQDGLPLQFYSDKSCRRYNKFCVPLLGCIGLLGILPTFSLNAAWGLALIILMVILYGTIWGVEMFRQGNRKLSRLHNILIFTATSLGAVALCWSIIIIPVLSISGIFDHNAERVSYYDEELGEESILTVYHDDIPLTLEELGIDTTVATYNQTDAFRSQSIFGTYTIYSQMLFNEDYMSSEDYSIYPDISYDILDCKWDKIRQSYIDDTLTEYATEHKDISDTEGTLWNADTVYALHDEEGQEYGRLVVSKDRIVLIYSYFIDYTPEQIAVMQENLIK